MTRQRALYGLVVTLFVGLAAGSYAVAGKFDGPPKVPNTKKFEARLDGFQEVPAVSTMAFGKFKAKLVNDTTIEYEFTYSGLEGGNSRFAHVHFAQESVNGGVSFFLCDNIAPPDSPITCPHGAGTVAGTITAANVTGPDGQGIEVGSFAEILRAMRAGHAYVNIHTDRWPGGEIRGQINDRGHDDDD